MSKKQVLIVTHKLGHNYGGIIQAYALQAYLRQHGLEPTTTNFSYNRLKSRLGRPIKDLLKRVIHIVKPSVSDLPSHYDDLVSLKTQRFIDAHIQVLNDKQNSPAMLGTILTLSSRVAIRFGEIFMYLLPSICLTLPMGKK